MRTLVYLDHSVLSNLAKGTCFVPLKAFTELVHSDTVLFPFSWTHHREAVLDPNLEDAVYRVGARLSRGLRFETPGHVVSRQARRAFVRWAGRGDPDFVRREAYDHDPDADIPDRLMDSMLHARVTLGAEGRELAQRNKELFANSLSQERASRVVSQTFEQAKKRWAAENTQFYFESPYRKCLARGETRDLIDLSMLQFGEAVAEEVFGPLGRRLSVEDVLADLKTFFDFCRSEQCQQIPFIDIESSIRASLEFDERSRAYGPGDLHDIETWSAYLPYVDMAVADQNMCALLARRHLAARYGCAVFPHTRDGLEGLLAAMRRAA